MISINNLNVKFPPFMIFLDVVSKLSDPERYLEGGSLYLPTSHLPGRIEQAV
jgi:hypothetical protein